ncbi:MAG: ATP-binding protein [Pseudomonadota bacterium]
MDPRRNPFTPGAGNAPAELAGREAIIEAADIAFDRTLNGLFAKDQILLGLRGVGKTVLLNTLRDMAKAKGFETIRFEAAGPGELGRNLTQDLGVILRKLDLKERADAYLGRAALALQSFAAIFRIKIEGIDFGVRPAAEAPIVSGDLERDLPELMLAVLDAAARRKGAIGLFIDEVQYLEKRELAALARLCHEVAQAGLPFVFVGAGLPQIAKLAGDAKSYAERLFDYPDVGPLDAAAARQALVEPAARFDATFEEQALAEIIARTEGYPYFLQTWGKFAWDEAEGDTITLDAVRLAEPAIVADLDRSFFRTRFDRLSPAERTYLRAMAELGPGPHKTGAIAKALGSKSAKVATTRKRLAALGMIYAPGYGETAFTVPLFDAFMKRVMPELTPRTPRRHRA